MNTTDNQTEQTYPAPIQVWEDAHGNKYAAQVLAPTEVIFYCRGSGKDRSGAVTFKAATVPTDILPHHLQRLTREGQGSDRDLTWIEQRELYNAARSQNPTPERSLGDAISYPDRIQIDSATLDKIAELLTHRCRVATLQTIRRRLSSPSTLHNYGIYSRLQISPTVSYCAGQDYPAELAEIRRLLIKN